MKSDVRDVLEIVEGVALALLALAVGAVWWVMDGLVATWQKARRKR